MTARLMWHPKASQTTRIADEPTFRLFDHDVSNVSALELHFIEIGRASLADEASYLGRRVRSALESHGVSDRDLFRTADFARLMSWAKYAAQVTPELQTALRDLAERLWCGLTGDETCPIKVVEDLQ